MASNPEPNSRHDDILAELVRGLYCPSCGCDLYNTAGCRMCQVMRKAWDALVEAGRKEPRKWAAYAEPDEINKRNMALAQPSATVAEQIAQDWFSFAPQYRTKASLIAVIQEAIDRAGRP